MAYKPQTSFAPPAAALQQAYQVGAQPSPSSAFGAASYPTSPGPIQHSMPPTLSPAPAFAPPTYGSAGAAAPNFGTPPNPAPAPSAGFGQPPTGSAGAAAPNFGTPPNPAPAPSAGFGQPPTQTPAAPAPVGQPGPVSSGYPLMPSASATAATTAPTVTPALPTAQPGPYGMPGMSAPPTGTQTPSPSTAQPSPYPVPGSLASQQQPAQPQPRAQPLPGQGQAPTSQPPVGPYGMLGQPMPSSIPQPGAYGLPGQIQPGMPGYPASPGGATPPQPAVASPYGLMPGPLPTAGLVPGPLPAAQPGAVHQPAAVPSFGLASPGAATPAGSAPGDMSQQQQPKPKMDPASFPNPISFLQLSAPDEYNTRQSIAGTPPPFVLSNTRIIDQGCASPRALRMSLYNVPATKDLLNLTGLPMVATLRPLARACEGEMVPSVVDRSAHGPVRCSRCQAYMNAWDVFLDGGRKYRCALCEKVNDTPPECYSPLDANGMRMDALSRPELCRGTVDYIPNASYQLHEPSPIATVFVVDVSAPSVQAGVLQQVITHLKEVLPSLPGRPVAIMTVDSAIHFYTLNANQSEPQMLVVPDVDDVFLPVAAKDMLLVCPEKSAKPLNALFDRLPSMFGNTQDSCCALGSALHAAFFMLKSCNGGRIIAFSRTLPNVGLGALQDRTALGANSKVKETDQMKPQSRWYATFAEQSALAKISIDLFAFGSRSQDLVSFTPMQEMTCGQLYYYPGFYAGAPDGRLQEQFGTDLRHNLTREIGYEGVMRVRTSSGVALAGYEGNHYMSNRTDLELAALNEDTTFLVKMKHEEKLKDGAMVVVQAALLYTTAEGKRRIRVHTIALPVVSKVAAVFRGSDLGAVMHQYAHDALSHLQLSSGSPRDALVNNCIKLLHAYRRHCAAQSSPGQLILPETLKLLPVYLLGLFKHDLFAPGNHITVDQRVYLRQLLRWLDPASLQLMLYPRLIPLHEGSLLDTCPLREDGLAVLAMPEALRLQRDSIRRAGVYLMDAGVEMFVFIGSSATPEQLQLLFVSLPADASQSSPRIALAPPSHSAEAARLHALLRTLRTGGPHSTRPLFPPITVLRGGADSSPQSQHALRRFLSLLIEDRSQDPAFNLSYVNFLCHVHRQIQLKMQ
eukprot:CAMPEP_0174246610 /NCGR_PEP_ID=MMETSP0417-20130205/42158_1 /TAXON_ID=242541 /ORGANISM="Mayorella sp, Strain BSH-02190019" /LENGTH=1133 /DNA_ID=CAMNT_0015326463 /DNA_START=167 /DNA_END=3568 /DNA_ORIENTATION=-